MPVALITLHRYSSWMPDRREGFVHYRRGLSEPDERLARFYRANQAYPERIFDNLAQRLLVEELLDASAPLQVEHYAIGTEWAHAHLLCGWRDRRSDVQIRRAIKYSLSLALNRRIERRPWFTRGGHVKRVAKGPHFAYLRDEYIPSHPGWKWAPKVGLYLFRDELDG
jgi:hypothetical protein